VACARQSRAEHAYQRLALTLAPRISPRPGPKITALRQDLDHYLHYYNIDRAHTCRLTQGRITADIVYGARKMGAAR
jgi:hypothetical protein